MSKQSPQGPADEINDLRCAFPLFRSDQPAPSSGIRSDPVVQMIGHCCGIEHRKTESANESESDLANISTHIYLALIAPTALMSPTERGNWLSTFSVQFELGSREVASVTLLRSRSNVAVLSTDNETWSHPFAPLRHESLQTPLTAGAEIQVAGFDPTRPDPGQPPVVTKREVHKGRATSATEIELTFDRDPTELIGRPVVADSGFGGFIASASIDNGKTTAVLASLDDIRSAYF